MLSNLFIHKIYAIRNTANGQNALGEPAYSNSSTVGSPYIPAWIQGWNDITEYRGSGLRDKNQTLIYIPPTYFLFQHDKLYNDSNLYLGLVFGINTAYGPGGVIDHFEVIVENP